MTAAVIVGAVLAVALAIGVICVAVADSHVTDFDDFDDDADDWTVQP